MNIELTNADIIATAIWSIIIGGSLIAWIVSMRRHIRRGDEFLHGIDLLLGRGVVPNMDRVRYKRTGDGYVVAFEGPCGKTGQKHEVVVMLTRSDRQDLQFTPTVRRIIT